MLILFSHDYLTDLVFMYQMWQDTITLAKDLGFLRQEMDKFHSKLLTFLQILT